MSHVYFKFTDGDKIIEYEKDLPESWNVILTEFVLLLDKVGYQFKSDEIKDELDSIADDVKTGMAAKRLI